MKSETDAPSYRETFPHEEVQASTDRLVVMQCKSCETLGSKIYCAGCGNELSARRITLQGIAHEVFHFFTHLDKGYLFTLKLLIKQPGRMQRSYLEGDRKRYQKPFSMFFICLTVAALCRYWIFRNVYEADSDTSGEIVFFDKYMVLFHVFLLPINALITYAFFFRSKYNYAEIAVLSLYTISFLLLISVVISLLKFYWPDLDTAYIELPAILIYISITNIHFLNSEKPLTVVLKSIGITICLFTIVQLTEDFIVNKIS